MKQKKEAEKTKILSCFVKPVGKFKHRELTKEEKRLIEKTKSISIKEGAANAVSDGLGNRYITPYALQLGASNAHIGLLTSLPSLLGNFSQLFTPKLMEKFSRKKIVFIGAFLQAIMWLCVIAVGVLFFIFGIDSTITPGLLVLIYTLLVLFGAFMSPAWNSWMKDIIVSGSGKYFGTRSRVLGFVGLVSMLTGGFLLDYFKQTKVFIGFIILFGIAFLARTISSFLFRKQYEPKLTCEKEYYFSFWEFLKKMPQSNFGRFVILIALVQLTTAIASPFFSVYMLKNLGFSYIQWMFVTLASSLASFLFMIFWGKFADKYGNLKVVKICGILIPFIPLLWLLSAFIIHGTNNLLIFLCVTEAFSGLIWAGFNLSSSNFIYDAVTRQRMALCIAYFNILSGIGVFIGATLGGALSSINFTFLGLSPILFLFLLSGIGRLVAIILVSAKIKEVRDVKKFGIKEATKKLSNLTPDELFRHLDLNFRIKRPKFAQ